MSRKKISLTEVKSRIKNHQLWLKWDNEDKKWNFKNLDIYTSAHDYYNNNPSWTDEDFYNVFIGHNLTEASFEDTDIRDIKFRWTVLKWTDFRNSDFEFSQFTDEQNQEAVFTDKNLEKYELKKEIEIENLENENTELKEENKENKELLEETSEEQTLELIEWFKEIKEEFEKEEKNWLFFVLYLFLYLLQLRGVHHLHRYRMILRFVEHL